MDPTVNRKLLDLAAEAEQGAEVKLKVQSSEVDSALKTWVGLNYVRFSFVATSALLGATAIVLF